MLFMLRGFGGMLCILSVLMIAGYAHDAKSPLSFGSSIDSVTGGERTFSFGMPEYRKTNDVSFSVLRGYIKDVYGNHACYWVQVANIRKGLGEGGIIQYMVNCERFNYAVRVKYGSDDLISVVKI